MTHAALNGGLFHLPILYYVLVATRLCLTLAPQRGYIHPDEYFQNMEVIAGDLFSVHACRTWEFNNTFPLRNILVPKATFGPPYYFIRSLAPFVQNYNVDLLSPYFLLVLPRLVFFIFSLVNDYCMYKICTLYGQNYQTRLTVLASSYVMLVYSVHTFSNSFEMVFFSVLLLLVAQCMRKSDRIIYHEEFLQDKYRRASSVVDRVKLYKLKTHLPDHSLTHVVSIATVAVIGFFNRPTFLGFAFAPIFFWLQRGLGSTVVSFKDFHYRIITMGLCAFPIVICLIIIDSVYYGYLTLSEIESLKITLKNFAITPLNFLLYNMRSENLELHGVHPYYLHFVINLPLLFSVLGVMGQITVVLNTYRFIIGHYVKLPKVQSITGLMLSSFVTPILVLSMFAHQEPRFILPVLIPLIYLYGNYLFYTEDDSHSIKKLKKSLLVIWYVTNFLLTIFYGFLHQGGIYSLMNRLHTEIKNDKLFGRDTHIISSHLYGMPTSLFHIKSPDRMFTNDAPTITKRSHLPRVVFYEYNSLPIEELFMNIENVLSLADRNVEISKRQYRAYLAVPCSKEVSIGDIAFSKKNISLIEEEKFFFHWSSEAIPSLPSSLDQYCLGTLENRSYSKQLNLIDQSYCWLRRFCLKLYSVSRRINRIS